MVAHPGENGKSHLRRPLYIPLILLDRKSARPLHRQLCDQIKATIQPETRLPSTRLLATYLGVSRNTVVAAYDELASQGLIEARQGSGVYVRGASSKPRGIEAIAKAACFPSRQIVIADLDGNSIAMNY
jgi:GntR family transcriptional regulator/MocR family aminotransferase